MYGQNIMLDELQNAQQHSPLVGNKTTWKCVNNLLTAITWQKDDQKSKMQHLYHNPNTKPLHHGRLI